MNTRPEKDEYAEFYANYVSLVEENDIVTALREQTNNVRELLGGISTEKQNYRYAEGKWSVREVLGHLVDAERVFSYRALRISRGDETPLASFEENFYVAESNFAWTEFSDLLEEFSALRQSNVLLFKNLTDEMRLRRGTASGATVSVRALAFIMCGHVSHHANILRTRYLN